MPMNHRILRPLARPLLLDAVPGAAAAYSLRQLSNAYTGPVVTVRRSSDDAEADFKASEIDDGTLAAFCGAGDGFVKTWFDQSGNNLDASQATSANQPKIVDSGSLITKNGRPLVSFDGTTFLSATSALASQSGVAFCVYDTTGGQFRVSQANPASAFNSFSLDTTTASPLFPRLLDITAVTANIASGSIKSISGNVAIVVYSSNGASWSLRTDGMAEVITVTQGTDTGVWFGDYQYPFEIQRLNRSAPIVTASDNFEIIIYDGQKAADTIERIEGDIAWYF